MAKKSRTPPPPRPVQAPKKRSEPRRPRRTRLWLAVGAAALLVAVAAGALVLMVGRGGAEAGSDVCTRQTFPSQGQGHVPPKKLPKDFEYNSYPPTTGPHHPQPLVFGEYVQPVPQNHLVHNHEHGGIGVQYGADVPDGVVRQLTDWYRADARGLVLAPLPATGKAEKLRDKIVLTAWTAEREDPDNPESPIGKQEGHLATCSTFDEDAFSDFRDDYRAKGPELFTLEHLNPGE